MRIDTKTRSNPLRRRLRRIGMWERCEEAQAFIELHHREMGRSVESARKRVAQVRRELGRHGWYEHSPEELAFGARVAWRNHSRCIGRLLWRSLEVFDCRAVEGRDGIAERVFEHMRIAGSGGAVRSLISIFGPVKGEALPAYIESRQIAQYAGYVGTDGAVLGDPLNAEATRIARSLGWVPPEPRSRFDLLPLIIRDAADRRAFVPLPADAVRQIEILHPTHARVRGLGLRWYTVPCVSGMILTIGGVDYPCAPFNGYYMGTEIASRNFGDERRYDLLAEVALAIGIPLDDPLWKDRALVELNAAVLHSFRGAGATIVDHHEASRQYMDFIQREAAEGRTASGAWGWIVPPQASSACPVFHLAMKDRMMVPNFYWSRGSDGADLAPRYDDLSYYGKWRDRWDRLRRRYFRWRRRRD
ncbi:MAG: nitric oxide synthase oxygenase [Planctomycetota bacterium]